jgi:hypothetical protein
MADEQEGRSPDTHEQVVVSETISDLDQLRESLTTAAARASRISPNLGQDYLAVSEDRVRLCLKIRDEILQAKGFWHLPLGILASLVAALVTTKSFKDTLGLSGAVWEALFVLACLVCVFRLLRGWWLWRSLPVRDQDLEVVIRCLKGHP